MSGHDNIAQQVKSIFPSQSIELFEDYCSGLFRHEEPVSSVAGKGDKPGGVQIIVVPEANHESTMPVFVEFVNHFPHPKGLGTRL